MINITSDISNVRAVSVAFVNCHDATTFGRTVHMTAHEERRLRGLLDALRDAGIILAADPLWLNVAATVVSTMIWSPTWKFLIFPLNPPISGSPGFGFASAVNGPVPLAGTSIVANWSIAHRQTRRGSVWRGDRSLVASFISTVSLPFRLAPDRLGAPVVSRRTSFVNLIVLIIVLMILFGGGGFYYGGPYVGGGLGTVLLIILIVLLLRG